MKISTSENIQEVIAELVLLFNSFLRTFVDAIIIKWRNKEQNTIDFNIKANINIIGE